MRYVKTLYRARTRMTTLQNYLLKIKRMHIVYNIRHIFFCDVRGIVVELYRRFIHVAYSYIVKILNF